MCVYVCVYVRAYVCVCLCMCKRERERERESVCVRKMKMLRFIVLAKLVILAQAVHVFRVLSVQPGGRVELIAHSMEIDH